MNSRQRRVARRRIEAYVGGFEMARVNIEAAARAVKAFGLSMQQINSSLLRAAEDKTAPAALALLRASPFPTRKLVSLTTPPDSHLQLMLGETKF